MKCSWPGKAPVSVLRVLLIRRADGGGGKNQGESLAKTNQGRKPVSRGRKRRTSCPSGRRRCCPSLPTLKKKLILVEAKKKERRRNRPPPGTDRKQLVNGEAVASLGKGKGGGEEKRKKKERENYLLFYTPLEKARCWRHDPEMPSRMTKMLDSPVPS